MVLQSKYQPAKEAQMSKSLTSILFKAARLSADGRALRKGPTAAAKRVVRKQVYRSVNVPLATVLRRILK